MRNKIGEVVWQVIEIGPQMSELNLVGNGELRKIIEQVSHQIKVNLWEE